MMLFLFCFVFSFFGGIDSILMPLFLFRFSGSWPWQKGRRMDIKRKLLLTVLLLSVLVVVVEYFVLSDYVPSSLRQEKLDRKNYKQGRGRFHSRLHSSWTEQAVKFTQSTKNTQGTQSIASAQQINGPRSRQYEETQLLVRRARKSEKLKRREIRKTVGNFSEGKPEKSQMKTNNQRTITMEAKTHVKSRGARSENRLVLFYTPLFEETPWQGLDDTAEFTHFRGKPCAVTKCSLTYDQYLFSRSDVVVFHGQDMPPEFELEELNTRRPKGQMWVYIVLESPSNARDTYFFNDMFNWTITYELNSDIYLPYGFYVALQPGEKSPYQKIDPSKKDRLLVWTVSNCGGIRNSFVSELMDHIRVDVFGWCSENFYQPELQSDDCERDTPECDNLLKRYKFQLAFENGLCVDYITEKYWGSPLSLGIVPVVLGGANYSKLAIPGSYINALDFDSVKALADYLLDLDKNDTAYMDYFDWHKKFRVDGFLHTSSFNEHYPWTCNLCEKAQTPGSKTYPNFNQCRDPERLCGLHEDKIYEMIDQNSDQYAAQRRQNFNSYEDEDFDQDENEDEDVDEDND